ncbi:electron transport complex subunit RsxG [Celerinatantimonas yamalensis]|uniref:Ion-translocating oxidoreductase complex subunit G n=1 Tax=Celerinatantimonas yamalensis TaxID=559956 RepID=A0ABW9G4P1_9GAMM
MNTATIKPPHTQAVILASFALLVTLLVMFSNRWLGPLIVAQEHRDQLSKIQQVLPHALYDNDPSRHEITLTLNNGQTVDYFLATLKGQPSAFIFNSIAQGYSGDIRLMIGIQTNGVLSGVRVLEHHETPGLGDKIEADKSNWILQFRGLSLQNPSESQWMVTKDGGHFSAFSGATITPRGVVKGIRQTLEMFRQYHTVFMHHKEVDNGH